MLHATYEQLNADSDSRQLEKNGFRLFILSELQQLWERVKKVNREMTYAMLAETMKRRFARNFSETNIWDLIRGSAKSPSQNTTGQIRLVLEDILRTSESDVAPGQKPGSSDVAFNDRAAETELQLWKRRAKAAEGQLTEIRNGLRTLLNLTGNLPPEPLSSTALDESQRAAKRASASAKSDPAN